MKNSFQKVLWIIVLIFISDIAFCQPGEIKIKFIGNAGLYLTDGTLNIYVDFPYKSGAHKYMKYDKSEIDSIKDNAVFIFTHRHSDHYSKKLLKKLNGKKYGPWNISDLDKLNDSAKSFSIQAFKTRHRFSPKHHSYLISWHNRKIYINGDTGDAETIIKLNNIDWIFAPYWIYYNARDEHITINYKILWIYHLYPFQKIGEGFPDNIRFLIQQNQVITLPY